jgi:predicted PurR-regulated permease PerM
MMWTFSCGEPVHNLGERDATLKQHQRQTATVLTWAAVAALAYLVYLVTRPFLIPLGWAGVLAVVFYPLHTQLAARLGPARAAAATTTTATLIVVVPCLFVATIFLREALDALTSLQTAFSDGRLGWVERAWAELRRRIPAARQIELSSIAAGTARDTATFILTLSGLAIRDAGVFVVHLVVALFATFFLLRDSAAIMRTIRRLIPMAEAEREAMLRTTRDLVSVGVTSAAIVAAVQGFLGGLVFALLGLPAPVFWGVVMGFFCLLPFGAWVIWAPAAVALALNGDFLRATILVGAGAAVVSGADNVLRPMLLAGRAHMNGLVILLSLLGGLAAFGALGLVLGPVVVVTALGVVSGLVAPAPSNSH